MNIKLSKNQLKNFLNQSRSTKLIGTTAVTLSLASLNLSIPSVSATASCPPVNLGLAGDYAILATTTKLSMSNSQTSIGTAGTNGNVGLGPKATQNFSQGQIQGTFFVDPTANNSKSSNVVFHNGTQIKDLSPAVAAVQQAVTQASSLTPTQTFDTINNYTNISSTGSVNVIAITNKIQLSGQTLTFQGSASDYFIVNVAGDVNLSGSSQILVSGGLTPANVLFNVGGKVAQSGDSIVNGTFLVPNGTVSNASANFYGAIYAPEIALSGGAGVDGYRGIPFGTGLTSSCSTDTTTLGETQSTSTQTTSIIYAD